MPEDDNPSPEDFQEMQEMLRRLLSGDLSALGEEERQALAGLGIDASMLPQMMSQLQHAFTAPAGDSPSGIDWDAARTQALHLANKDSLAIAESSRAEFEQAFALGSLWLSEATTVSELPTPATPITRSQWVEATLPVWRELAEPVADSIAGALVSAMGDQVPEEMRGMVEQASVMLRRVGGSLFAAQLGSVIGRLSLEVVSGGDVGIPVMPDGQAVILPQNFADFGRDLEVSDDQLALYLATRELAHGRLFRHARWLRLHVISQVTEYARGLHIDMDAIEQVVSGFDPTEPERLRHALESGALIPARTPAQQAALTRLENLLATIEGWVETVTADATSRLPDAARIAEAVRRRRAVGGPAERAMASLVGLELRPRRLREAAAMWRSIGDAVGIAARDGLWDYPDLMPSAEDIDDPTALIARLQAQARGEQPERDAMDDALDALLSGRPFEGEGEGEAPVDDGDDTAESDEGPAGPTPV